MVDQHQLLKKYFGYERFREGQEILIDSVLSGKDTLGIMPTGAGKSICFQIPALLLPGITLVISPLISLMKDQVSALNQAGIHAAFFNSSLTHRQYQTALRYACEGRYKIIYVAPERLESQEFLQFCLQSEISMISVDEAHCVSQWGQDFRPSYLKILQFLNVLPHRPIISAFTATATWEVKEDIVRILQLQEPTVLVTGYDRKNLYFSVLHPSDKYKTLREYVLENQKKCGIIYCLTRTAVEEVCDKLNMEGIQATRYHAGLSDLERKQNQDDFTYDKKSVMVATNAFGMGIDKSNVNYVIHYNMPKNMESYYQEAGRAGRDGEPAECILYYEGKDVVTNQFFIDHNTENELLDPAALEEVQIRDRERLKKMTFYCFTNDCLRDYILRYFGEYGDNYCGNCGNCLTKFEETDVTDLAIKIVGCVKSCRGRFGINMIIDTLRGSKSAKILRCRMDENEFYQSGTDFSSAHIRLVLNQLLLKEYLRLTDDEYAVLKLTETSESLLFGTTSILMKTVKESEQGKNPSKKKKSTEHTSFDYDETLFDNLRNIRRQLAQEQKVPSYIVFADKTLKEMAAKKPVSREEMLNISGVGAMKFEKYGDIFLKAISSEMA